MQLTGAMCVTRWGLCMPSKRRHTVTAWCNRLPGALLLVGPLSQAAPAIRLLLASTVCQVLTPLLYIAAAASEEKETVELAALLVALVRQVLTGSGPQVNLMRALDPRSTPNARNDATRKALPATVSKSFNDAEQR